MGDFTSICRDYVSEIDKLLHEKNSLADQASPKRVAEIAQFARINQLRDVVLKDEEKVEKLSLWEEF